ncbi:MAG: FRG domain-containing protein [Pseudohongiella sp.]|nr:FRG domain-containing protein [Pseudohongiella sp.]
MTTSEVRIGALSTFIRELGELGDSGSTLRYFRGHSKIDFELLPSIYRNHGWLQNEDRMLKELILRCPDDFRRDLSTFQCLVKMQHYGLPTRLLDITSNPMVALYFACEVHVADDKDGAVLVFDYDVEAVKYFDSDTVSVLSNLSRRPNDFTLPEVSDQRDWESDTAIDKFNAYPAIKLLLHDIGNDKAHFAPKIKPDDIGRVICVKPLLDNPRIIRQEGAFLLFGCGKTKDQPAKLTSSASVRKLVISKEKKQSIRNELARIGITHATLFPEIERVAQFIRDTNYVAPPKVLDTKDLGSSLLKIIDALNTHGVGTVGEIVNLSGVKRPAVLRALSNLKERGIVRAEGKRASSRWLLTDDALSQQESLR